MRIVEIENCSVCPYFFGHAKSGYACEHRHVKLNGFNPDENGCTLKIAANSAQLPLSEPCPKWSKGSNVPSVCPLFDGSEKFSSVKYCGEQPCQITGTASDS